MIRPAVLNALRDATADLHGRAEAAANVENALATRTSYRQLLAQFLRAHAPVEAALKASGEPFVRERAGKTRWLCQDLEELGVSVDYQEAKPFLTLDTPGAAVGAAYVIEGATLGGQLVSRMLADRLEIGPENGGRFFHGYGAETREKWAEFASWAEANADDLTILTAQQTFQHFIDTFESS